MRNHQSLYLILSKIFLFLSLLNPTNSFAKVPAEYAYFTEGGVKYEVTEGDEAPISICIIGLEDNFDQKSLVIPESFMLKGFSRSEWEPGWPELREGVVTKIGNGAFKNSHIQNIVLPPTVKVIGEFAFCDTYISEISLPSGLIYIGECAFVSTWLDSIIIPESVIMIGESAFEGRTSLNTVTLPSTLKALGGSVFRNCGFYERSILLCDRTSDSFRY